MTNNKEKRAKKNKERERKGENAGKGKTLYHISHLVFGKIFSIARSLHNCEWVRQLCVAFFPLLASHTWPHFWLLPVTVTTHTCKPDTLLPPLPPPLNACQHWQSLFTTSHALFIKATHQFSSISPPCAWHMPCSLKDLSVKYSQINERYICTIYMHGKSV